MVRFDVLVVFQMEQGPKLFVAPYDNVTSTSTIAAVGSSFGNVLFPSEMGGASSAIAGFGVDFYVINEVIRCHYL
jgi:hypothetical protein